MPRWPFPEWFFTGLVLGAVVLCAAGCVLMARAVLADRKEGKLW